MSTGISPGIVFALLCCWLVYPVHYCESRVGTADTLANFPIQRILTGQQFRSQPDFTICLIQAALIYADAILCVSKLCDLHIAVRLTHTLLESHQQELLSSFMYVARTFPVSVHTHHIHSTKLWLSTHSILFGGQPNAKWMDISVSLFPWDQPVTSV